MKKILIVLSLIIICKISFAQNPIGDSLGIKQNSGNAPNTILQTNALKVAGGVQFGYFPDTVIANASSTKAKYYPNAVISTLEGMWQRSIDATRWIKIINSDDLTNIVGCYSLFNGGVVTWSGTGLGMDVSPANYTIGCGIYHSPQSQVTLAASHATLNRIDVIAVNTSEQVIVITGTPSVNPVKPQVNPATQLELTQILVPANATTPGGVSSITVYDENVEWTSGSALSQGSVNFNSTSNPYHLTKSALTAMDTYGRLYWDTTGYLPISNFTALKLYIRQTTTVSVGSNAWGYSVSLRRNGGAISYDLNIQDYGFDPNIFNTYQTVTIPISDFVIVESGSNPGTLQGISFRASPFSPIFNIDYIQLQSGIPSGNSPYVTDVFSRNDSLFQIKNGIAYYIDTLGSGSSGATYNIHPVTNPTGFNQLAKQRGSSDTLDVKALRIQVNGSTVTPTLSDTTLSFNIIASTTGGSGFGIDSTVIGGAASSVLFVGASNKLAQQNDFLRYNSTTHVLSAAGGFRGDTAGDDIKLIPGDGNLMLRGIAYQAWLDNTYGMFLETGYTANGNTMVTGNAGTVMDRYLTTSSHFQVADIFNGSVPAPTGLVEAINSSGTKVLNLTSAGVLTVPNLTLSGLSNGGVAADSVLVITSAGVVKKRNASAFSGSSVKDTVYWALSGQSNAWGANQANQLDTAASADVMVWQHAQAVPAWQIFRINQRPLRTAGYNSVDGGGLAPQYNGSNNAMFYAAKEYARVHNCVVKIVMAIGDGSPIGAWYAGNAPQKYLDSLTTRIVASGIPRLDFMQWDQGENNYSGYAGTYKRDFDSISAIVRRTANSPNMGIAVTGMPKLNQGANKVFTSLDTLLRDLEGWTDPNLAYVQTNGCGLDNNAVHFDTTALFTIGHRLVQAFESLPRGYNSLYNAFNNNVFNGDTMSYIPYAARYGTITPVRNDFTMASTSYMSDSLNGIVGDGFIDLDVNTTGTLIIALDTTATANYYYNGSTIVQKYVAACYSGYIAFGAVGDAGTSVITDTTNVTAIRLVREAGNTVKLQIRVKDHYNTLYEYPAKYSGTLYAKVSSLVSGTLVGSKRIMLESAVNTNTYDQVSYKAVSSGGAVTTMSPIGSSPNANGATISGSTLTLQPASASFGGVVTSGTQSFNGNKTINGNFAVAPYAPTATGGTITTSGGYTIHTFTSSGTFTPNGNMTVEYLVVGGGGSGGEYTFSAGGGGGAGAMLTGSTSVTATPYTITVGAGGVDSDGGNSVFSSITATGGGKGGNALGGAGSNGNNGGSGGGGGGTLASDGAGGTGTTGGNNGGNSFPSGSSPQAGGGGGAGAAGGAGIVNVSGNGGAGLSSSISGSAVTYAGGGGGSRWNAGGANGTGGAGGGGNGSDGTGGNGTANTGGGGGGGQSAGNGGSGIVIIRYLTPANAIETDSNSLTKINKLQVLDSLKYNKGTSLNGKVLTSDANGNASWQAPTSGYTFSTGLSGTTTITVNLSTGVSGGQTLIGSTSTNSGITYKATTGVGTTGANHTFTTGNNGGTTAFTILNSGQLVLNSGYNAGTFNGTQTRGLGVDASNNVITYESASTSFSSYTPTLTNTTNISSSTAFVTNYYVIGDLVTVFGSVTVDPTSIGATVLTMSVPIGSTANSSIDVGGTAASATVTGEAIAIDAGGSGNVQFLWTATDISSHTLKFQFSYKAVF